MGGDSTGERWGNTPGLSFLILSSDKFPPARVDVSVLFGQEMIRRGHHIDWVLQSESACDESYKVEWMGSSVWVGATDLGTSRLRRIRKHLLGFLHDFVIFKCARQKKYDFIQVKDKFIIAPFAALLAKSKGSIFVYWLSYPFPEASLLRSRDGTARYPILYLIRGWILKIMLYRMIIPLSKHVFVQSEQMKRDLIAEGVPSDKLTPVPMGVTIEALPELECENKAELANKGYRVVYLGTLLKVRKMDFLVRVFSHVVAHIPEAHLYLVGAGDDESDEVVLWNEAEKLGISNKISITGFLPQSEAWHYVLSAHVCVSPFYPTPILNSTSPTKLIEYMALGKAVVANDHPEQKLVIDESGAGICVAYKEEAFADAIIKLLLDPVCAANMGKRGREYVNSNRTYRQISRMVESRYLELIRDTKAF